MKSVFLLFATAILLSSCFGTVPIPCDKPIIMPAPAEQKLPWPEQPCRHLKELTAGTTGTQKLAIVLAANKACIENLEITLKKTGRVEDPK